MENEFFDLSRSEWEKLIDEWIVGRNASRNRQILKTKLLDGVSHEKTAEIYDMSTRQVKNIVKKGLNTLSKKLH